MQENSRRLFLKNGLMSFAAVPLLRRSAWAAPESVPVTLEGRADDLGVEIVSFGLPLPFGFLRDSQNVKNQTVTEVRNLQSQPRDHRRDLLASRAQIQALPTRYD